MPDPLPQIPGFQIPPGAWQARGVRDYTSLIVQISKGLIRNQRARRLMMFYGVIVALVMLFLGSVFLPWMREYPILFILYWGACAWLTIFAMLLAIFDLLVLRAAERRTRRQLEAEYLEELRRKQKDDSDSSGTGGS